MNRPHFIASRRSPQRPAGCYVYGKHVVDLALERRPDTIRVLYVSPTFRDEKLLAKVRRHAVRVEELDERRLSRHMPRDVNHQGIVAQIDDTALLVPYQQYMKTATLNQHTLFLVLAEVQDPQNVGAMIRSAAAFGVQAVLLPTQQQAPITGVVAKVSAGMVFTVPVVQIKNVNTTIADLHDRGARVYGLAGEGAASVHDQEFATPSVFVVGNEGAGLRAKTRTMCDVLMQIPIHPRCESLNAAAAVSVSLAVWSGQVGPEVVYTLQK